MSYQATTGNVSLQIKNIGPGDEGEYTCTAQNQYGEAVCAVYIQTEGMEAIYTLLRRSHHDHESLSMKTEEKKTAHRRTVFIQA